MAIKAATKKTAKKTTAKKPASKTVAKKKTTSKKTTKKTVAKKTTAKKTVSAKKTVTKTTAKKAPTKAKSTKTSTVKSSTKAKTKTSEKKQVAKKSAAAKKASSKKTSVKTTTKSATKKKTVSKPKVSKKVSTAAEDIVIPPEETPKPAAKKATTKKTTKKRASSKKAKREKVVVVGKVGQAPRRTADEVAASNPFPVPPQIQEEIEEQPSEPSEESKLAKKDFRVEDQIVYPAHGVGVIEAIESQEIVGTKIEVFVIRFEHEKLRLRVPTDKAKAVGMRELSTPEFVEKTIIVLQGRARIKRTMWSRRAQEYEAKINSGDLNAVAEVVRDLYRAPEQPEQSYSERQLFEAALDRMAREVAAVKKIDLAAAVSELDASLQKKQIAAA